ncbi:TPA: fimbria/pilus outer membrane usher protein [Citrobacter freundii]|nr:fimbria/pilus outer membrane usher protein [Citrobacter freundii]
MTIHESDGNEQHMIVPYATLPSLVREGHFRYSLTAGDYRSYYSGGSKLPFIQGTGTWGLPWDISFSGGLQNAGSRYQSLSLGAGKNMGSPGAFSVSLTHAESSFKHDHPQGQSIRLLYNKNVLFTGSNITLAGYRYSTEGYRTLNEVLDNRSTGFPLSHYNSKRRNRAELMINQSMADYGMLHATLVNEDYWNKNRKTQSVTLGYNHYFGGVSMGISYAYNRNPHFHHGRDADQLFSLTLNIPLASSDKNTWLTYSATHQQGAGTLQSAGMSGTLLEGNNLAWGGHTGQSRDHNHSIAGNINWKTPRGTLSGGYSHDQFSRNASYGISGAAVMHAKGITFSGPLGETIALVEAQGAADVKLRNLQGETTDHAGYALVPWLTPYRINEITLDNESLPKDTDVMLMTPKVIPTRGAVVRAEYQVRTGNRMLIQLLRVDNSPVPFGAMVTLIGDDASQAAIVGDQGVVYLSGLPETGQLMARWNNERTDQCQARFDAGGKDPRSGLYHKTVICYP